MSSPGKTLRIALGLALGLALLLYGRPSAADENGTSASVTVTVTVPSHPGGRIELPPPSQPAARTAPGTPLPLSVLDRLGGAKVAASVVPVEGVGALPRGVVRLHGEASSVALGAEPVVVELPAGGADSPAISYQPTALVPPGRYQARLMLRPLDSAEAPVPSVVDLDLEVPPFLSFDTADAQLRFGRRHAGHVEVSITTNAERWTLRYRVEPGAGTVLPTDLRLSLEDEAALACVVEATGPASGVINGVGIVDAQRLRFAAATTGDGHGQAVVVFEASCEE